jgi:hypothetical protein
MRGGYVGLMNCVFAAQKAVRPPYCYVTVTSLSLEVARPLGLEHNHDKYPSSLHSPTLLHLDSHPSARYMPTREC